MLRSLILLACIPLAAVAEDPPRQPPVETATEALLRVQSSNQQASTKLQRQTASERDQSMYRWLETYKYPIPDHFRWVKISTENN